MIRLITGHLYKRDQLKVGPAVFDPIIGRMNKSKSNLTALLTQYVSQHASQAASQPPLSIEEVGLLYRDLVHIEIHTHPRGKVSRKQEAVRPILQRCRSAAEAIILHRLIVTGALLSDKGFRQVILAIPNLLSPSTRETFNQLPVGLLLSNQEKLYHLLACIDTGSQYEPTGFSEADAVFFQPFIPQLAKDSMIEAVKWETYSLAQEKFDGNRLLIHYQLDPRSQTEKVQAFSKKKNETKTYPTVLVMFVALLKQVGITSCIADGEIVSSQGLQALKRGEGHLFYVIFDCLYLNGQMLTNKPYVERFASLSNRLNVPTIGLGAEKPGNVRITCAQTCPISPTTVKSLLTRVVKSGGEGLILRNPQGVYLFGSREDMLKLKQYKTLDCLVMGGKYALTGSRQHGFASLLLGVRDGNQILPIPFAGSGMTNALSAQLTAQLKETQNPHPSFIMPASASLMGEIRWVEPGLVIEVGCNNTTISSLYPGNISLQFPRLLHVREDKGMEDVNTIEDVKNMFTL